MAVTIDIEQLTLRNGSAHRRFGDPWEGISQAKMEHDRYLYVYGVCGHLPFADFDAGNRQLMEMGRQFGWKGIRWERIRKDKSVHIFSYPIPPLEDRSHLDAGIPVIATPNK